MEVVSGGQSTQLDWPSVGATPAVHWPHREVPDDEANLPASRTTGERNGQTWSC